MFDVCGGFSDPFPNSYLYYQTWHSTIYKTSLWRNMLSVLKCQEHVSSKKKDPQRGWAKAQSPPPIFFHLDLTGKISMHIFVNHRILWNWVAWYSGRRREELKPGWLCVGVIILKFKKNCSGEGKKLTFMERLVYSRTIMHASHLLLNPHNDSKREMLTSPGLVEETED